MFVEDFEHKRVLIERLLEEPQDTPPGDLRHVIERVLQRREVLFACATSHATPFYLFDRDSFDAALYEFRRRFDPHVSNHRPFYAVKSNHHPLVVGSAVRAGYGLDVSSRRELALSLESGAEWIVFSGPAKSATDLELAVQHADRTVVNIDSFQELRRLAEATSRLGRPIRAGVRIHTAHHGKWSKFGIPLVDLPDFWHEAGRYPLVELQGIQSHLSWTHDPTPYCRVIKEVAACLRDRFTPEERASIRFYDFGGGYRPHGLEGRLPTELPLGELIQIADDHYGEESRFSAPFYMQDSVPLETYAREIGAALVTHLDPVVRCSHYSEPGRIVSSMSMHLVMRVVDKKRADLVIVDGGIHMVGWERYLHVYAPIVNLTRPSLDRVPVRICGSLCDPEDMIGLDCYGTAIEEGDILLMPYQGAYSFSTAQSFIRDIPAVHRLQA